MSTEGPTQLLLACHERIRRHAAIAVRLVEEQAPEREIAEAAQALTRYFGVAMPLHVLDEDRSIAPRLGPALRDALDAMTREHRDIEAQLALLLPSWREIAAQPARRDALVPALTLARELAGALDAHLVREESTWLPELATALDDRARAAILDEMRVRRDAPGARVVGGGGLVSLRRA